MALLWLGFSLAYRLFFGRRLVVETTTERIDSFVDRPEIPDTIFGEPRGQIGGTRDGIDLVECDNRTDSRHNVWVRFEVDSTATLVGAFSNETPDSALDDSPLKGWVSNV